MGVVMVEVNHEIRFFLIKTVAYIKKVLLVNSYPKYPKVPFRVEGKNRQNQTLALYPPLPPLPKGGGKGG